MAIDIVRKPIRRKRIELAVGNSDVNDGTDRQPEIIVVFRDRNPNHDNDDDIARRGLDLIIKDDRTEPAGKIDFGVRGNIGGYIVLGIAQLVDDNAPAGLDQTISPDANLKRDFERAARTVETTTTARRHTGVVFVAVDRTSCRPADYAEAEMKISRAVSISCFAYLAIETFGVPAARADGCELATAAAIAQAKVPYATTHVTTVAGAAPARAEMIFTADKAYLQVNGAWRSMDYSPQAHIDRINAVKSSAERANQTCEKPASDTVKGDAATVLVMHTDAGGKRSDARLWISDKSGLPLKSEIRIDGGNEIAIVTDDFRYDHIEAPTGVK